MESSFLGSTLLSGTSEIPASEALKAPVLAIYFSAHWCPPCRRFTPILAKEYNLWNKEKKEIEIVFVSSDRDQAGFDEYYKEMPWLALPFKNSEVKLQLKNKYGISGIPTLVIVDKAGKLLSMEARDDIEESEAAALVKFQSLYK